MSTYEIIVRYSKVRAGVAVAFPLIISAVFLIDLSSGGRFYARISSGEYITSILLLLGISWIVYSVSADGVRALFSKNSFVVVTDRKCTLDNGEYFLFKDVSYLKKITKPLKKDSISIFTGKEVFYVRTIF